MYLEVYVDVIFVINFIMDLVLLFMVKEIVKLKTTKLKLLGGAAFGGISACIMSVLPNLNVILQFIISYIVITTFMIKITFGKLKSRTGIKACIILYISTFFLGGILNSLYYNSRLGYYFAQLLEGKLIYERSFLYFILSSLALVIAIIIFIFIINNLRSGELALYNTELTYGSNKIKLVGLLDTGNSLYDPISKKPVLVMYVEALTKLLSNEEMSFLNMILNTTGEKTKNHSITNTKIQSTDDNTAEKLKIRMIPYHSIGKSGMMPAIVIDQVVIWDEEEQISNNHVLIAVSGTRISKQNEYQIILHREIM